jgi:hypothetical protein
VAPLRLGGLRGKKSTPSIGWEVLVKSRWSVSGSCMERAGCHSERAIRQRYAFFVVWSIVLELMLESTFLLG